VTENASTFAVDAGAADSAAQGRRSREGGLLTSMRTSKWRDRNRARDKAHDIYPPGPRGNDVMTPAVVNYLQGTIASIQASYLT